MKRLAVSLLGLVASAVCVPQVVQKSSPADQDLTQDQKAAVMRLANLEKNFATKMNSPGAELTLKEVGRSRGNDRTFVRYELYTTGLPKNVTYTLFQVQINGAILKNLAGVTLDSNGQAICAGREGTCRGGSPNSPIQLALFAGTGEPKRLSLVSDDEAHLKASVEVVPFPNSVTDRGCTLESILGTPKGEITYVRGSGFEPNEEIAVESDSSGEKLHATEKAEADGSYFEVFMPNVLGKTSGTTVVRATGRNCSPELTFSWGTHQLQ
jgi:hypothetical protein